ncbi:unnamed protein product, partial [Timema podura]|nr:unnamed protein product [Timema podura]
RNPLESLTNSLSLLLIHNLLNEDNDTSLCYELQSSSAEVSIQSFAPNVQPSELGEDAREMEFNQDPNRDQPKSHNPRKSLDAVIQRYKDFIKKTEKPN